MGVRAPVTPAARRAFAALAALLLLLATGLGAAGDSRERFWSDFWRAEGELTGSSAAHEPQGHRPPPQWFDALDLGATLLASSAAPEWGAELTLRLRLDAAAYLERSRAEARDLAGLARALDRQARDSELLQRLAARCVGAWRAQQVRLIDLITPGAATASLLGRPDPDLDYLRGLRELLALDATRSAEAGQALGCRLEGVLDALELSPHHPRLVAEQFERSIDARTRAMLTAPAPASAWLRADLRPGNPGVGGGLRFGLELPIPVPGSELDLSLGSEGSGAFARLSWYRSGLAARQPNHALWADTPFDLEALERELGDALQRRVLEARLMLSAAERQWSEACSRGSAAASVAMRAVVDGSGRFADPVGVRAVVDCLTDGPHDDAHLAALLVAIDAEIAALQALLGAVAASGQELSALLRPP